MNTESKAGEALDLNKSRAEFEAWYVQRHPQPVHENSTWAHASKMDDWEVWQAALARRSLPVDASDEQDAIDPNVFFDALSDYNDSSMSVSDGQRFFDKLNERAALAAKVQQAAEQTREKQLEAVVRHHTSEN